MSARSYTFHFMVMAMRAELDDTQIRVKVGLRSYRIPLASLRYLYIIDHEEVGRELVLAYEPAPNRRRNVRLNVSHGEAEFDAFVDDLLRTRPAIDIRHLPIDEAHQLMGATNYVRIAPAIAIPLLLGIVGIMVSPMLLHGLDRGQASYDVDAFGDSAFSPETRNVSVTGVMLWSHSMRVTGSSNGLSSTEFYVPLVPQDWAAQEPVSVVVRTTSEDDAALVTGVLRTVLWEGLEADAREFLEGPEIGVHLSEQVVVLDRDPHVARDFALAVGVLVVTAAILGVAAVVLRRRTSQRSRRAPASAAP